jgi:hypothetical protein
MNTKPAIVLGFSLVLASAVIALVPRFAPPSTSGKTELTSELAQLKNELAQAKSELSQVKSELAKQRAPQETARVQGGGRYQLFMDSKGERAYLFDPETGEVLDARLTSGTENWNIAVRARK